MKKNISFAVQVGGVEYDVKKTEEKVKEKIKEKGILMKKVEKIDVYMKPEENKAYYVAHGTDGDSSDNDFVLLEEE